MSEYQGKVEKVFSDGVNTFIIIGGNQYRVIGKAKNYVGFIGPGATVSFGLDANSDLTYIKKVDFKPERDSVKPPESSQTAIAGSPTNSVKPPLGEIPPASETAAVAANPIKKLSEREATSEKIKWHALLNNAAVVISRAWQPSPNLTHEENIDNCLNWLKTVASNLEKFIDEKVGEHGGK